MVHQDERAEELGIELVRREDGADRKAVADPVPLIGREAMQDGPKARGGVLFHDRLYKLRPLRKNATRMAREGRLHESGLRA